MFYLERSSALNMEAAISVETLVPAYQTTWSHIPEDRELKNPAMSSYIAFFYPEDVGSKIPETLLPIYLMIVYYISEVRNLKNLHSPHTYSAVLPGNWRQQPAPKPS
jgi:hypothetical protein